MGIIENSLKSTRPFPVTKEIRSTGSSENDWLALLPSLALPPLDLDTFFSRRSRLIVVAPHPDDEVLGCGGLICMAANRGVTVEVVAVTDGEGSYADHPVMTRSKLKAVRPGETEAAIRMLCPTNSRIHRLKIDDGLITKNQAKLCKFLNDLCQSDDVIVSTWRSDLHPDHETVGSVSAEVAKTKKALHLEVPVWAWNWAEVTATALPFDQALSLSLTDTTREHKKIAIECFKTQIERPDIATQPVLSRETLSYFNRSFEIFFVAKSQ